MRLPLPSLAACAALCACTTTSGPTLHPLSQLAVHPLDYRAELTGVGLLENELGTAGLEAAPDDTTTAIHLRVRTVAMSLKTARRLIGWTPRAGRAWSTRRADARRFLERCSELDGVRVTTSPELMMFEGQEASISVTNQTAYVKGYRVQFDGTTALADPVVDVFTDGILLMASGRVEEAQNTVELDLDVMLSDLRRPIPEYEASLMTHTSPVTIQQPVASSQRLQARIGIPADQTLVLVAARLDGSNEQLFFFVTADATTRPKTGEAAGSSKRVAAHP